MEEKTLEYYYEDGTHIIFNKYTINTCGAIINEKNGRVMRYPEGRRYNECVIRENDGRQRKILIGRAIASTFLGPPSTPSHTADHIDRNPMNDTLENIRWLCKSGQNNNRVMPRTCKSSFIIVKDGVEKTTQEWFEYLKDDTNPFGRKYTSGIISHYAHQKKHGFSYKVYPTWPDELWLRIPNSENNKGHWEISNMNRVKSVTKHGENVIYGDRLSLVDGYPTITINTKHLKCHILSFSTFFPEEYANMTKTEEILHEDDNRLDFRPYKLRIGTRSENNLDAHNNGSYGGKLQARMKCASYINNIFEKEHTSQTSAVMYLKSFGYETAHQSGVWQALRAFRDGKQIMRYGRTWKVI